MFSESFSNIYSIVRCPTLLVTISVLCAPLSAAAQSSSPPSPSNLGTYLEFAQCPSPASNRACSAAGNQPQLAVFGVYSFDDLSDSQKEYFQNSRGFLNSIRDTELADAGIGDCTTPFVVTKSWREYNAYSCGMQDMRNNCGTSEQNLDSVYYHLFLTAAVACEALGCEVKVFEECIHGSCSETVPTGQLGHYPKLIACDGRAYVECQPTNQTRQPTGSSIGGGVTPPGPTTGGGVGKGAAVRITRTPAVD